MNIYGRNALIWVVVIVVVVGLVNMFQGGLNPTYNKMIYSDFLVKLKNKEVTEVKVGDRRISGRLADSSANTFIVDIPFDAKLMDDLRDSGVKIEASSAVDADSSSFINGIAPWLSFLLFIGFWIFMFRNMQGGSGKAMSFGRSRAKLLTEKNEKVTFQNVAGIDEAKDELSELVDFLKNPQKFQKLGGKIPRGCLLVGPPGTGKTLLARAIAGEAGVPFFTISGSDFVEMFVGVGASRVRDMFEQAKKHAPCIVFIDEIDAVGRHRGFGHGGGNDEREQTLNQLLVEMDGFEPNESIIIIAATNRPDVLDPALLRPGRFDRQITVPNPDIKGREAILNVHLKKVPTAPDVDAHVIARGTPGFSGADLANLVNEAALMAARYDKKVVTMVELESAKDKVMMGAERKSMVMSEDEKRMTAYHESGHAIVSIHCPASDPIHKATIIPRGRALGMVVRLPESDKVSYLREKMHANLAVSMGGRVAEEIIFGYDKVSSGASSDIKYATTLARAMVLQWGMSDKLGPQFFGDEQQEVYLGHSMGASQSVSAETRKLIDAEVKMIIDNAYNHAKELLTKYRDQLELVAESLLEFETLSGDEINALMKGEKPKRMTEAEKLTPTRKSNLRAKPKAEEEQASE